jgi:hypothetical protein
MWHRRHTYIYIVIIYTLFRSRVKDPGAAQHKRFSTVLELCRTAGQRDVADRCVVPDAGRSIGILVNHLQILGVGSYRYYHPPTGLQLLKQRLRDLRCGCTHMNSIEWCRVRPAKPSICNIANGIKTSQDRNALCTYILSLLYRCVHISAH